ncbi:MAG: pyridoxine 5'-phosphate synthase [Elusimicrobia bacterium]|nr:pyridoxine 5'-phosphate synthase [Elusimicrobiota bacterium]
MPLLGVNIDHIATLRQQRREGDPDPVAAALLCQKAGAHSIVAHLREDRRHIQDEDVRRLKKVLKIPFNLEMSIAPEIVGIACRLKPAQATLVPERRQELTTEGGLDVIRGGRRLQNTCCRLKDEGIVVSLFIDPDPRQIDAAVSLGVGAIEIHTGAYAQAKTVHSRRKEREKIVRMTAYGCQRGLVVNAGHGLKYHDVRPIARISGMHELNIGHSIVSRAAFVGLERAVREMKALVK